MASSRPLDIVARFRTVTTEFNTREVEKELDDAGRAFDNSARDAQEWSRKIDRASRDVSADMRRAGDDAGDAGREVGQEFASNIGEGIGSGQIDIQDAILGTLGGLASVPVIGPAALIGGTIVASIVGAVQANNEKMRQAGISLWSAFQDGVLESSEKEQVLIDAFGVDSFKGVTDEIAKQAKTLKVPTADLLAYYKSFGDVITPALAAAFKRADDAVIGGARGRGITVSGLYRQAVTDARTFVGNIEAESEKVQGAVKTNITADDIISDTAQRETLTRIEKQRDAWLGTRGQIDTYVQSLDDVKVYEEQIATDAQRTADAKVQQVEADARRGRTLEQALRDLEVAEYLNRQSADSAERQAQAAERTRDAMRLAADYARKGSSYAVGGSTYNSQVPRAAREP